MRFSIIRLKTWFDEHSIAPFRGNDPLTPDPRVVKLVDDRGRYTLPQPQIAEELRITATPLRPSLRPLILDLDPVSRLLIDSENSLWHGKIYLSLGPNPSANASTIH